MTREEFFEWLNTCPTSWLTVKDDVDVITVSFHHIAEEEEEEEEENAA